jgi:hypothetical protein
MHLQGREEGNCDSEIPSLDEILALLRETPLPLTKLTAGLAQAHIRFAPGPGGGPAAITRFVDGIPRRLSADERLQSNGNRHYPGPQRQSGHGKT